MTSLGNNNPGSKKGLAVRENPEPTRHIPPTRRLPGQMPMSAEAREGLRSAALGVLRAAYPDYRVVPVDGLDRSLGRPPLAGEVKLVVGRLPLPEDEGAALRRQPAA